MLHADQLRGMARLPQFRQARIESKGQLGTLRPQSLERLKAFPGATRRLDRLITIHIEALLEATPIGNHVLRPMPGRAQPQSLEVVVTRVRVGVRQLERFTPLLFDQRRQTMRRGFIFRARENAVLDTETAGSPFREM